MKTAQFPLNNKELLLVELPEGERVKKHIVSPICIDGNWGGSIDISIELQEWQPIGKLSEVTEEQYQELVHFFIYEDEQTKENVYRDYRGLGFYDTAKESFFSALTASGIFFENPLPDPELTMRQGNGSVYYGASDEEFEEYSRMEEKVFNIDNTVLFEKV